PSLWKPSAKNFKLRQERHLPSMPPLNGLFHFVNRRSTTIPRLRRFLGARVARGLAGHFSHPCVAEGRLNNQTSLRSNSQTINHPPTYEHEKNYCTHGGNAFY